jgi:hypothetical protein
LRSALSARITQEAAVIANAIAKFTRISRIKRALQASTRGIETLEKEWKEQDQLVKAQQTKVDKMKNEFGISDWEAQYGYSMSTVEPETLRKLEGLRIEAQAEYASISTLLWPAHQHDSARAQKGSRDRGAGRATCATD